MLKLEPLEGYVLVEVIDEQGVRESGFVEPESSKEKPAKGRVINVAKDAPVGTGDIIVFKRWQGQDIREDGKDLKFVEFKHIMGVYG